MKDETLEEARIHRKITLADVAAEAGVSLATASKALNNQPRVSDATRAKVIEIAKRLDYAPNTFAQSLATGKPTPSASSPPILSADGASPS